MQVVDTAKTMTWQQWVRGALYAAVHGAGQGLMAFAIGIGWKKALALIASSLIVGIGIYIKSNPLPGEKSNNG